MALPASINLMEGIPHRHGQRPVFQVRADFYPMELRIEISHQSQGETVLKDSATESSPFEKVTFRRLEATLL